MRVTTTQGTPQADNPWNNGEIHHTRSSSGGDGVVNTGTSVVVGVSNGTIAHHPPQHNIPTSSCILSSVNNSTQPSSPNATNALDSNTPDSSSSSLHNPHDLPSSPQEQFHQTQQSSYNGIYLVDGVHGVRVGGNRSRIPISHDLMLTTAPSIHQYGLPAPPNTMSTGTTTVSTGTSTRIGLGETGTSVISCSTTVPNQVRSNTVSLPVPSPVTTTTVVTNHTSTNSGPGPKVMEVGMSTTPSPVTIVSTPTTSPSQRILISTEAQTEDLPTLAPPPPPARNREQRKRERRERGRGGGGGGHRERHKPSNSSSNGPSANNGHQSHSQSQSNPEDALVSSQTPPGRLSPYPPGVTLNDLNSLNSTGLPPPPYTTLPQNSERRLTMPIPSLMPPPPIVGPPPPTCLPSPPPQPVRYHFGRSTRASRRSLRIPRGIPYASEEEPKSCCGMSASQAVSIRWFIIVIAVIGICCTVSGTALGATRSHGNQHLTLSLLMIGVGVVLLTVSAVAWRLTANEGGTSCRTMLGFGRAGSQAGDGGAEPNRRFVPRLPPYAGRPHHPFAAMMYPEFQYRPPPPSYQASMQEYRLRLLLLERSNPTMAAAAALGNPAGLSMVPPPAYRPYTGYRLGVGHLTQEVDYSRPPSYRSREGYPEHHHPHLDISRQSIYEEEPIDSPIHSRDPSILSYLSAQSVVGVAETHRRSSSEDQRHIRHHPNSTSVSVMLDGRDDKCEPVDDGGEVEDKKRDPNADSNVVRIVQTTHSSQVIGGKESVIVTVSSNSWDQSFGTNSVQSHNSGNVSTIPVRGNCDAGSEIQILTLAHL